MDLNKLLQAASLVPEGGEVRWEVEAERCVQISFLIGFMGYRDEEPDGTGLPRNLTDVKRLIAEAKSDASLPRIENSQYLLASRFISILVFWISWKIWVPT